jgi:hypothetical protein
MPVRPGLIDESHLPAEVVPVNLARLGERRRQDHEGAAHRLAGGGRSRRGRDSRAGAERREHGRRGEDAEVFTPGQAVVGHLVPPGAQYKPSALPGEEE